MLSNIKQRQLLAITLSTSAVAMILPSFVTQVNWLYPDGLAPIKVRKAVLVGSWVLAGAVLVGAFLIIKNGNGQKQLGYNHSRL